MNDTPTPDLVPFQIVFRSTEERPTYQATADVLAAISADWQRHKPSNPLALAVQRDPAMQVYQVYAMNGRPRVLMFRLDDVLYIG